MTRSRFPWPSRPRVTVIPVIVATLLLSVIAACGGTMSDSTSPEPGIVFDKESANLRGAGGLDGNQAVEETFLIVNQGDSVFQVGPPSITRITGCDSAVTVETGISLPPGEMGRLAVQVVGHDHEGPHGVELSVPSDDPQKPLTTLKVNFKVNAVKANVPRGPRLSVDKEMVDIGVVPYDRPLYERFSLHNSGDAPLTIDSLPEVRTEDGC